MSHAIGREQPGCWTVTDMQPGDLPDIVEIERASFPNPWSAALFLQELRLPFSRMLVARERSAGTTLVGYLCRWFVADEIHVLNVAVHPGHRRRGIAALLMREALREARDFAPRR